MHVLLFGATGMIGHGALDACLSDDTVTRVRGLTENALLAGGSAA